MRVNSASSSTSISFCADCLMSSEYLGTRADALQAFRAVSLVRNGPLLSARLRHKAVPEVLPDGPVLFQVDLNGHLAALPIGDKLDPGHDSIFLQAELPATPTLLK